MNTDLELSSQAPPENVVRPQLSAWQQRKQNLCRFSGRAVPMDTDTESGRAACPFCGQSVRLYVRKGVSLRFGDHAIHPVSKGQLAAWAAGAASWADRKADKKADTDASLGV